MLISQSYLEFNKNIISIIFLLYILCYIIGPAPINILLTFLSIFSIYYLYKKRNLWPDIFKDKSCLFLIFFFLYIFVRELFEEKFNLEILTFLRIVVIYLSIYLISFNKTYHHLNLKLFLIFYIPIIIDCFIQFYFNKNIFGFPIYDGYRLTSFFKDEPIVGSFLFKISVPIICFYYVVEKKINILFIILILFSFLAILLSGERMPFIQISLSIFIISLIYFRDALKKVLILYLILTLSFFILFLLNDKIYNRYINTFENILLILNVSNHDNSILKQTSGYEYSLNFKSGINLWANNKIFGGGYRNYKENCKIEITNPELVDGCSTHPHNLFIELLADYGIIGLIIFYFFIYQCLKSFYCSNKFNKYFGILLVSILLVFPFSTSQSIFSSYYGSIFFLYFIILKYLTHSNYNSVQFK